MEKNKAVFHLIWGILLALMGIALGVRVPEVMERIVQIEYYAAIKWFIRIIIYLIAVLLIGGGGKKAYDNFRLLTTEDSN